MFFEIAMVVAVLHKPGGTFQQVIRKQFFSTREMVWGSVVLLALPLLFFCFDVCNLQ